MTDSETPIPTWKQADLKYEKELSEKDLKSCVREFFKYLDAVETSDSGKEFHPTYISSCRTMTMIRLGQLLPRMKELAKEDEYNVEQSVQKLADRWTQELENWGKPVNELGRGKKCQLDGDLSCLYVILNRAKGGK